MIGLFMLYHNVVGSQSGHNLELSLGSLSSKRSNLEPPMDEEASIGMDQRVPTAFEPDWKRNTRPKVYISLCISYPKFLIFPISSCI